LLIGPPSLAKSRQSTPNHYISPRVVSLLGASLSNKSAIALFRGNLEICCTVIAAETDKEAHRRDLTQINTRPFSEANNVP
jgi:hypothetical protein